jgi:hypothetical protein
MWVQFLAILVIGLSVGWLAGLSVSPVAGTVVGGLLGLVGGLGAGAMVWGSNRLRQTLGQETAPERGEIDLQPAAVLALAVAVGVPLGILARTHQVFGAGGMGAAEAQAAGPVSPVLFGARLGDCAELVAASRGDDEAYFRRLVRESSTLDARLEGELPPDSLRTVVRALCAT